MGTTRSEALDTLREGQERLDELLADLPDAEMERAATIGDGDWSAKDLIGHIATWEELALRAIDEWRGGEIPWVETSEGPFSAPATGKIDAVNARTVAEKRALSLQETRDRARDIHSRLMRSLEEIPDEEWTAKAFYPTPNNRRRHLSTLLGAILAGPGRPFGHASHHGTDLESFVQTLRPSG
jgi:hypothetical protein